MKALFPDWRAQGVTICLHEHQGGFAFNVESVLGLRDKCLGEGVSVLEGVEVTGLASRDDGSVSAVETTAGSIEVGEQVVIAPGPWAARFWSLLGMPDTIDIRTPSGDVVRDRPMWTYWNLQEGEITVDPLMFATADGGAPPVIHLDTDAPLRTDDGDLVTDELWGIYFKRDRHGVQGGASPLVVDGDVELDPYPSTTDVDPSFPDMWCAALSHSMSRFEGCRAQYKAGAVGRRRSVHGRQLPRLRLRAAERLRDLRLEPRLQDDRCRPRGRRRAPRRPLAAALPVPVRALRDGGPAPGLELAVSLVVVAPRSRLVDDHRVLIFLLLGWVPWPLVLALAVVMWLTVVELLEWRPHYAWWVWWLLLVFMTNFIGYLFLRAYGVYRRYKLERA